MGKRSTFDDGIVGSGSKHARDLARKLTDLIGGVSITMHQLWYQKDGSVGFECTDSRGVRYKGIDSKQGIVAKSSSGEMYYTVVLSGVEAGRQALETYFGEEFQFVKGSFKGEANYKHYSSRSGDYQIATTKEDGQTLGRIILPSGQVRRFVGHEGYIEIDEDSDD